MKKLSWFFIFFIFLYSCKTVPHYGSISNFAFLNSDPDFALYLEKSQTDGLYHAIINKFIQNFDAKIAQYITDHTQSVSIVGFVDNQQKNIFQIAVAGDYSRFFVKMAFSKWKKQKINKKFIQYYDEQKNIYASMVSPFLILLSNADLEIPLLQFSVAAPVIANPAYFSVPVHNFGQIQDYVQNKEHAGFYIKNLGNLFTKIFTLPLHISTDIAYGTIKSNNVDFFAQIFIQFKDKRFLTVAKLLLAFVTTDIQTIEENTLAMEYVPFNINTVIKNNLKINDGM